MSIEAMQWAFNQDIKPSSVKFVLVSLGDNAQHDGMAWPSIAALCQKTGQDRKTVISALDKLETLGFLKDSGKRCGKTGQVKVYQFNFARQNSTETGTVSANSTKNTENGTVPKTEQFRNSHQTVPDSPSNSTVFPPKSTENGTRNPQEPSKEPKGNPQGPSRGTRLAAEWVLPKAWGEWALSEFPAWSADHVRKVALMFKNYWIAKTGKDATKLDWFATWQNWCLKEPAVPAGAKKPEGEGNWWESASGIEAKGKALGLEMKPGEVFPTYKVRVYQAAGDGPWMNTIRGATTSQGFRTAGDLAGVQA